MLPEVEYDSHVLRLKRSHIERAGWRTVLLVELPLTALQAANQWAADVRDVLPEPETADLYMFLMISGIAKDDAARICSPPPRVQAHHECRRVHQLSMRSYRKPSSWRSMELSM
jgi:hypothetical protein